MSFPEFNFSIEFGEIVVSGNWKRCRLPIQSAIYAKAFQNGTPFG